MITNCYGDVEFDTFVRDEYNGCYFEERCDDGEVIAWAHKPRAYKVKESKHG